MDKLLFITFLLLLSSSLNAQSMIIAHQEIAPDEAVLPLGVFSTNSMGLHAYSGVTDPLYPVSLTPTDEALLVRIKDLLITEHFCSGRGCW
ncbi:hypothetical protein IX84_15895 [Phaeodactylibacter xiamenensis]|uniref:Uncharacterized protein n=1 Tax=Phaeodactylibacter xiamenensis TaxID=1524460 RepID=A0A098S4R1_9BACT|nr:hypothetical protein IX84_15895 [Phaeodactylibacter xiamenensis]